MTSYPPEPWRLAGDAYLSVWLVPRDRLPRVPETARPVALGGRAVVVTAWFDYQPPGELSYHELLSTVSVHNGLLPTTTITEIWVDNEVSLAGGRELWAIPKELATLEFSAGKAFTASASTREDWIATAAFSPGPGLPVRAPVSFAVAQSRDGKPLVSPVRAVAKPRLASANWNINPDGPLGYLAGSEPVFSACLTDVGIRFGSSSGRRAGSSPSTA